MQTECTNIENQAAVGINLKFTSEWLEMALPQKAIIKGVYSLVVSKDQPIISDVLSANGNKLHT